MATIPMRAPLALALALVVALQLATGPGRAETDSGEQTEGDAGPSPFEACLIQYSRSASNIMTVGEMRNQCAKQTNRQDQSESNQSPLEQRQEMEELVVNNNFSLLPHRPNYLVPLNYTQYHNEDSLNSDEGGFLPVEIQFQLSVKVVLVDGLYRDRGRLAFAYTGKSFWQGYNLELSSPFREINHEPELILAFDNDWEVFGWRNAANNLVLSHESNGLSGDDSRSWNRIVVETLWERDRFSLQLRPWYRIPAPEPRYPGDPLGDDNPDILDYLGHFDLQLGYSGEISEYWLRARNNLDWNDNRGSLELGWSFPIHDRLRGRVSYFEGFGESLIDYDKRSRTLGIGVQFSGWL